MIKKRRDNYFLILGLFLWCQSVNAQVAADTIEQVPSFNSWTLIFAVLSGLGFVLTLALAFSKSRFSVGEKWMALLVFSFSMILTSYVFYWTKYAQTFPYFRGIWPFFIYLIGPSVYFYLKSSFQDQYTKREISKHFLLPTIIALLLLPGYLLNFEIRLWFTPNCTILGTSSHLMIAHLVFYTMRVQYLIKNDWQVDTNIKSWSLLVSKGLNGFTLAFISYYVLANATFFSPEWDYAISLVMAVSILTIAYMALIQKRVFSSEPIENFLPNSKYKQSQLTTSASQSIKKRLEQLLTEEKVFKENELRLDDLASYLDTSRHQLSQVINEQYGVNFFELINGYRVNYVKMLLQDENYSHWTILQIAFESGFNNKASFNRYFKKEMGLTPSAYRIKMCSSSSSCS